MQAEEEIDAIKNAVSLKSPEIKIPKLGKKEDEEKPAEGLSLIHISEPTRPY